MMRGLFTQRPERLRLVTEAVYVAAAVVVLCCTLALSMTRRGAGAANHVSPSDVSRTDLSVSPADASKEAGAADALSATDIPTPADNDFVRVRDYIPDAEVELIYSTDRNFTGKVIYDFSDAWLRYGTVRKLADAQEKLKKQGARLKIWDAFRPVSTQFRLWEICPDSRYVADPRKGYSSHSRGNTVDVTLVDRDGNELVMPTGFDDFSRLADRDYSDVKDAEAVSNVRLLENTMKECGFRPYAGEWWHFSDTVRYDAAEDFAPGENR